MKKKLLPVLTFLLFVFLAPNVFSQTKGLIYKPAGTGKTVLDPNLDGYTSASPSGFLVDDETESEIPYTPLPSAAAEPDSDLGPGPNCSFTDLVKSDENHSIYTYFDGTENLLFRFRLGGTADNSKGYSILIDTDQKFGATGPNADPNYVQGNPGFEIEVVLLTNFGVGLYDVDGTTSPTEIGSASADRPYSDFSQKSIAGSLICGDDDYFYDFYIPFSDLTTAFGITSSTPLRMLGNTVINPHEAMGNNGISDIGGIDDRTGIIDNLWEELIDIFPPTSADDINAGSTIPPRAECPTITGPISIGATSITGTSSEVDGAAIEVFRDGVSEGITTVTSGTWSLSGIAAAVGGEVFSATATASSAVAASTGTIEKSTSYSDCNETTVAQTCSAPPTAIATATGTKVFSGSASATGSYDVTVYDEAGNKVTPTAPGETNPQNFTGSTWQFVYATTGNKIPDGTYYFTVREVAKCESTKVEFCTSTTTSTAPTISGLPVLSSDNIISGSATAGASVKIYINGVEQATTVATSGSWSFNISGLPKGEINAGDIIKVRSIESGSCGAEISVTAEDQPVPPIIQGSYCTSTGSISSVSGISSEAGATINIYTSGSSPVIAGSSVTTTTVVANGNWTANVNIPVGNYVAATVLKAGSLESGLSNEVLITSQTTDGSLSIDSVTITEGDNSISGTGTDGNTVYLYLDGYIVDGFSAIVSGGTWTISGLDAASAGYDVLFAGGVTGVTAQNGALCESAIVSGPTIECKLPVSQNFAATTPTTICEAETISFQIDATESLVVYELVDQNGTGVGPAMLGMDDNSAISLTTFPLSVSDGIIDISVKAQRIGISCETFLTPSISVEVKPLPELTLNSTDLNVCKGDSSVNLEYTITANGPAYDYSIDFDNAAEAVGLADVLNNTTAGSPIAISVPPGISGGTYNGAFSIRNSNFVQCTSEQIAFTITVIAPEINSITPTDPSVCGASDGSLQLEGLEISNTYDGLSYYKNGVLINHGTFSSDAAGNYLITGLGAGSYSDFEIIYRGCTSPAFSGPVELSDPGAAGISEGTHTQPTNCSSPNGEIVLTGVNSGNYTVRYTYGGSQISQSLTATAGGIAIQNLDAGNYTNLYIEDASGCRSNVIEGPISLVNTGTPTITLGANPSISTGDTSADLTFTTTSNNPDEYSIDFDASAESEGFSDVGNIPFSASPIVITAPASAAAGTYNANLTVQNSSTGCVSGIYPITITLTSNGTPLANNDSYTGNEDSTISGDVSLNDTGSSDGGNVWSVVSNVSNGNLTLNTNGTFTYSPNANYNGSDSFTYKITDIDGDVSSTVTVTLNITAVEDATVVIDDSATTSEDTAIDIEVLANDTDPDTKSAVTSVTQGTNGTVVINGDGSLKYTPNLNFNGSDSFTYTNAEGNTANVAVTITAVDDATVVTDDSATTSEDTAIDIDVLANDTDSDTKSTVASVTQGTSGTVVINADGTLKYTPDTNFNGSDSFTYTNSEGTTGTVNVTITSVDDATVVADDSATTSEDTAIDIDVLANDTDPDTKSAVASVSQGTNGSVVINADGSLRYTPNLNFNGSDSFTYTNAEGATGIVNVTITAVDDATVISDDSATTSEDTAIDIDVLANDTDPDTKSAVTSVTQGTSGTVVINADGTLKYSPDADFNGSDSFTYTNAEGASGTVNVTITAVDNATVVTDDSATTSEDTAIDIDVLANDTDPDTKSAVASVTQGTSGTVVINGDGTLKYTPNLNFNGSDSFTYTNAEGTTGTVSITITAVDDATVVADDSATTPEDTAIDIDVLANDTDPDTKSAVASVTQGTSGTVVINADGTLKYTPDADFNGSDSFTYTNSEGNTANVAVTITAVDDATVVADDSATTSEDTAIDIDVLANDTDPDTKSAVASVSQGTNGSVVINADGTLKYTPGADFYGSDSFTYTNAEGATGTVNVTITAVDDATVVTDDSVSTNEDSAIDIDVLANDTDPDTKSAVTSVTQGTSGSVVINGDGTLKYTPNLNFNGSDSFTYTNAEGNTGTVSITITEVDDATVVTDDSATTPEDTAIDIDVLANDTDPDTKSAVASVTQGTSGTVVINADGTLKYTPDADFNGSDSFTYTNSEGKTANVAVTITTVDDVTVVADNSATTSEDTAIDIDVLANDIDPDTKSAVASVTQGTNGIVVINADGSLKYTPNLNFNGTDSFTYTNAEGTTGTVSITITAVDDATVVTDDSVSTNEDSAIDIDVLANDTDPDTKSAVTSVTQGTNGTVVINGDGSLKYTPNLNFNGSDSFTYTNAEGNTANVAVTITAVDDVTVVADDSSTTSEDTAIDIDVLANDTDPDTKSAVASVTQGTNGSVVINGDGTLKYTPNLNFNGTDSFTYTNAEGASGTVSITITAVDDATVVTDDSATTSEDTAIDIDVLANDTDPDTKSAVTSVTQGTSGTVVISGDGTLKYTPNLNFNGSDSFTYTNAEGATGTVSITITAVDDATVVTDDSATTSEDIALDIDVMANDIDPDTKSAVASVTQGTSGTVVINADGSLRYTPNLNFNGSDSFTYTNAEGATGIVNVTITAVDDATVVTDDSATTSEDTAIDIDVLANDTDPDTKSAVASVTQGTSGTVVINADGTLKYTPDADFNGSDSFTYTNAEGASGTVNVTITAVDNATVVTDDSATTSEDTAIDIDVLANDTDPDTKSAVTSVTQGTSGTVVINADGTLKYTPNADFNGSDSFTYTNAEGNTANVAVTITAVDDATVVADDSATTPEDTAIDIDVLANDIDPDTKSAVASVKQGTSGTVVINTDGTLKYTPDADFNGSDSFTYTNAEGATGTVNVTITAVDDVTVISDDSATTSEDTAIDIDVLANDTDPDTKSAVASVTQGTSGTVVISGDGTLKYTPNLNFNGTDSFTYTNAEGATATVSITITAVDDATVVTDDSVSINEDTAIDIDVLANDTDPDTKSAVASVSQGTSGTVVINGDGTLKYTPDADFYGSDSFTYTNAEGNTANVAVTITAVDDATVVLDDSVSTNEDTAIDIDVLANDSDPDTKSAVTSVTQGTNGSVVINGDGTLKYTPNLNFNGSDSFTYTNAEGASGTVSITIKAVDDATVVTDDSATTSEDTAIDIDVLANDTDPDTKSAVASVTQGTSGTVVINGDGTLKYTPNLNFNGSDSFTYTNAEGNTANVAVTITSVNDSPLLAANDTSISEGTTIVLTATATDADGGDTQTYAISGTDASMFSIDPTTGELTFKSAPDFENPADNDGNNIYEVTVIVTDARGNSDSKNISISVTDLNDETPALTANDTSVSEGTTAVLTATAADADAGDTQTYSINGTDASLFSIDPTTGELTFNSAPDFENPADADGNNNYELTVTVMDAGGNSDSKAVSVTVTNTNDEAPVLIVSNASISEGTTAVLTATATDADAGDTQTYAISGTDASLFSIDPTTGELTFKSAPDFENPLDADGDNIYEVTIMVTDANGNSETQVITVSITDVSDTDDDNDGLTNAEEINMGTDPNNSDSDGDRLSDGEEILGVDDPNTELIPEGLSDPLNECDPLQTSDSCDPDEDGLTNAEENILGTDPNSADSDGDGLTDGEEISGEDDLLTNLIPDGVSDPLNQCDPLKSFDSCDADNDGLTNLEERNLGTDPNSVDTDGDGLTDGEEISGRDDPLTELIPEGTSDPLNECDPLLSSAKCFGDGLKVNQKISPNGDGVNDWLEIEGIEFFPDNRIEIYNRWGVLVYDANTYGQGDNFFKGVSEGRLTIQKGEELPEGTYYYILSYKLGKEYKNLSGYIYINR